MAQLPVGWLADKFDRRTVLMWLSVTAPGLPARRRSRCRASAPGRSFSRPGFFGVTTMPIYSVSTAHAHDFATDEERVELSAALMFLYALGAIASPLIASTLIAWFGPASMFVFISPRSISAFWLRRAAHARRPAPADRTRYVYTPRTSFLIGRLLKRGGKED